MNKKRVGAQRMILNKAGRRNRTVHHDWNSSIRKPLVLKSFLTIKSTGGA
jgi:hypothetical protein